MRAKMLVLLATAVALIGIGVLSPLVSAATPAAETTAGKPPIVTPQVASECPASYICFWTGKTWGQAECKAGEVCFSAWHGYELGYHALANIDPQSMYNHTGERVASFAIGPLGEGNFAALPGEKLQFGGRWTKGFTIANCGGIWNC